MKSDNLARSLAMMEDELKRAEERVKIAEERVRHDDADDDIYIMMQCLFVCL